MSAGVDSCGAGTCTLDCRYLEKVSAKKRSVNYNNSHDNGMRPQLRLTLFVFSLWVLLVLLKIPFLPSSP